MTYHNSTLICACQEKKNYNEKLRGANRLKLLAPWRSYLPGRIFSLLGRLLRNSVMTIKPYVTVVFYASYDVFFYRLFDDPLDVFFDDETRAMSIS
jgi:hypothetical protein